MAEVADAFENLEDLKRQLNIGWFVEGTEEITRSPQFGFSQGKWEYYSLHLKNRPCFSRDEFCTFIEDIAKKYDLEVLTGEYSKLPFYLAKDGKPIARFYKDVKLEEKLYLWGIVVEVSRKDIMRDIFDYLKHNHADVMKQVA